MSEPVTSAGPILITGAAGQLGSYVMDELAAQRRSAIGWSHRQPEQSFGFSLTPVDIAKADMVRDALMAARPAAIIHAAAASSVAACYRDPRRARDVNVRATQQLARWAADQGVRFVLVSTDLVFDGTKGHYDELDRPSPLSVYGRTKQEAESAVLEHPGQLVVRVSLLFGPSLCRRPSFFDQQLEAIRQRRPMVLFEDEWRTPLSYAVAARGLLAAAGSDAAGCLHFGGAERMTRLELGQRLARFLNQPADVFQPGRRDQAAAAEPRPRDVSLDSTRWWQRFPAFVPPSFERSLEELRVV